VARALGSIEMVTDQLPRTYKIRVNPRKQQEEHYTPVTAYSVALPSRIGEAWVQSLGNKVTFRITPEGLLMEPDPKTDDVHELLNDILFKEVSKM
jgi:hypothetical protein